MNVTNIILAIVAVIVLGGGAFFLMDNKDAYTPPEGDAATMEGGDGTQETSQPGASAPTASLDDLAKTIDAELAAQMAAVGTLDTDVNSSASSVTSGAGGSIDTNF